MKASSFCILGIALALAAPATAQTVTQGTWTGTLNLSSGTRIDVEFMVEGENESLQIVMNAVGGPSTPLTDIELSDDGISFTWGAFSCSLERKGDSKYEGECGGVADGQLSLEAPSERSGRTDNVVTREQIAATDRGSVYDALRQLRPRWLTARGVGTRGAGNLTVSVYMGRQRMGDVEFLRTLDPQSVGEIRFYSSSEATTIFGTAGAGGVIVITRR